MDILSTTMLRGLFRIRLGLVALVLVSRGKVVVVTMMMMSCVNECNTSHHNLPLPVNTGTAADEPAGMSEQIQGSFGGVGGVGVGVGGGIGGGIEAIVIAMVMVIVLASASRFVWLVLQVLRVLRFFFSVGRFPV